VATLLIGQPQGHAPTLIKGGCKMGFDFNINEVLEMAQQIERNGASFYRKAAESVSDAENKETLLKLAELEDVHENTFATMQKSLSDKEKEAATFDPENESIKYLQALADMRVFFEKEIDISSMKNILKDAIIAEKDSILFYQAMKNMISDGLGKDKIDIIIKEEMSHIIILQNKLSGLKK
jgi:rubrerythrin